MFVRSGRLLQSARRPPPFCSVAPLMDISHFYFNYFCRVLTASSTLYTEMLVDKMLIHADASLRDARLRTLPHHHPITVQLGGNKAAELLAAAKICESAGFRDININAGCPSLRVAGKGDFGARLMLFPDLPAVLREVKSGLNPDTQLTIKHRIGVDEQDSYEFVRDFVLRCHEVGGINHFIVHARKAILEGLSPKQNRSVPPLNHAVVLRLKQELPHLHITINGGFRSANDIRAMIGKVDGVMVGRASYECPFVMSEFDAINQEADPSGQYLTSKYHTRAEVATAYAAFIANEMKSQPERKMPGVNSLLRPLNDLFHGLPRARKWREFLSTHSHKLPIEELVAHALQLTEKGE